MMGARTLRLPLITHIEFKGVKLIIMDSPSKDTIPHFVEECLRLGVTDIVRVCEDRYPKDDFESAGIHVHHWEFSDGSAPPDHILDQWFHLLRSKFFSPPKEDQERKAPGIIAVHCVAGLGRAPVLVAVALMELGMPCMDAIELISSKRKGSFNHRQLAYLTSYRPNSRLKRGFFHCGLL